MRIDPKQNDLSTSEASPVADGLLFWGSFVKERSRFCATYSTIDKAQISLKRVF